MTGERIEWRGDRVRYAVIRPSVDKAAQAIALQATRWLIGGNRSPEHQRHSRPKASEADMRSAEDLGKLTELWSDWLG